MKNSYSILFAISILLSSINSCAQSTEHIANLNNLQQETDIQKSVILLNNQNSIIPLKTLETRKIASINIGFSYASIFDSLLNKYSNISSFSSSAYNTDSLSLDDLSDGLKFYNTVIIQITDESVNNSKVIDFILEIQKNKQLILCAFGSFQILSKLNSINAPVIWTDKESSLSANFVAQLIFGGVGASARLNQNVSEKYKLGSGFSIVPTRLKYTVPEEVGINSSDLNAIDDIVAEAIREQATPSAVVMVLKDGKVIFNKSYGNHTYEGAQPSLITDIYDVASLTKTTATTPAVMRLYEQRKINLDTNIGAYIPKARKTNKNNITVRELMLHQAGFVGFIPFYKNISSKDYSHDSSAFFPVKAADNYYMRKGYFENTMWPQMLNSAIYNRGKYLYSDLSMYFMKEIVERQSGQPLQNYVQNEFYQSLGMKTAGFLPRNRFEKHQIVPTEDDTYFRKTLLWGYVHDQGAAMVGGVSGHAGLFASANDIAILYQMLLNKGTYGGSQYFKPETVDLFTSKQSNVSRRGLGFDKWDEDLPLGYPSKLASPKTFGHTGYTGTCVWVDPEYNLVYIFLSNRVYPKVVDKLGALRIRPRIQDVIYEAINKGKKL